MYKWKVRSAWVLCYYGRFNLLFEAQRVAPSQTYQPTRKRVNNEFWCGVIDIDIFVNCNWVNTR